jgi:hypothetical protein
MIKNPSKDDIRVVKNLFNKIKIQFKDKYKLDAKSTLVQKDDHATPARPKTAMFSVKAQPQESTLTRPSITLANAGITLIS